MPKPNDQVNWSKIDELIKRYDMIIDLTNRFRVLDQAIALSWNDKVHEELRKELGT